MNELIDDIEFVYKKGVEIAIVVGGGNFFRGSYYKELKLNPVAGDHMGMLATIINGIALRELLTQRNIPTVLFSVVPCPLICEIYNQRKAIEALEQNYIVICVGGTSVPFVTTDTASIVRGIELGCDVVMKGTKFPGVFSEDPQINPKATHYTNLTYQEVLSRKLAVMDSVAIDIAAQHRMPIVIFSLFFASPFSSVLAKKGIFTLVNEEGSISELTHV